MTASIAYGVEVDPNVFDGDLEEEINSTYDEFRIIDSQAEYNTDNTRKFLVLTDSLERTTPDDAVVGLGENLIAGDITQLTDFIDGIQGVISKPSWFLVEYYNV